MKLRLPMLSLVASSILTAATPMVPDSMSTDNGGTKSAIDAYSDGAGVLVINQAGDTKLDNSAMNSLVFKYGETAKSSNTTLKNQVSVLSADATAAEKATSVKFDLAKVVINPPVNGTSCDDGSPQTVSDIWTSGMCNGNNIENQLCNDGDIQTINDKYHNGVCMGTNVEGVACDDTNALTFADKYANGVCAGVTNGASCNDGNALTFADKYTAGVCSGIVNGTLCNDSNIQTINDQYTSGVCAGTNVQGQTCSDGYSLTTSDVYNNGVCAGSITGCQNISNGTCTSCSTGYTLAGGICLENISLSGNKWSDGSTSPTCWEYYTGKTTATKKYLPQTATTSYLLTDGRNPTCNMPALANLHNNGDWSGFFSFTTTNCLASGMISATDIFLHPQPTPAYCIGTVNTSSMFKTISFYITHANPSGDGAGWQISGSGIATQTAGIAPGTSTAIKTVSPTGTMYFSTNSPSGNNSYDHTHYIMTGYTE